MPSSKPAVHGGRGDERRALDGLDRVLVVLDLSWESTLLYSLSYGSTYSSLFK
jgi:hypothetical protein